ncbi:MAG: OmpA family protein [Nitrospirae bacterium]|nr:OmpA family protein [Nitrospirota bacterium]
MSHKKKKHEEHENHERWLVSYADFITLLFAFFVTMYSTSSVNEGKYRAVSDSAQAAFNPSNYKSKRIDVGPNMQASEKKQYQVEKIVAIREVLKELQVKEKIHVFNDKRGIIIRITDTAIFDSGSAEIRKDALESVDGLIGVLSSMSENLQVEGHTDNLPIKSPIYPSNWELSSARATSIVRRFIADGIDPKRLTAIGYGEYRPLADNDTEENRVKNRRVDIVVLTTSDKNNNSTQFVNPFANIKIE